MLPFQEWLSEAQKLTEGRSKRVGHLCGEGDVLIVEHNREGYRAYCHRCHESGWKPHGRQSLDQQLKRWESSNEDIITSSKIELPKDYTNSIHANGLIWLSRGGITSHLINKYRIGYSEYFGRVFLPVYINGYLAYYQARAVHEGQSPKYINPRTDKSSIRFTSIQNSDEPTIVVTEDILSAIRVGEVYGYRGCSILGTTASSADINYINSHRNTVLWFDPDLAGRKCTTVLSRSLQLLGNSHRTVISDKDPKTYTHRELEVMLNE
jgi:hypothetical protein